MYVVVTFILSTLVDWYFHYSSRSPSVRGEKYRSTADSDTASRVGGLHFGALSLSTRRARTPS